LPPAAARRARSPPGSPLPQQQPLKLLLLLPLLPLLPLPAASGSSAAAASGAARARCLLPAASCQLLLPTPTPAPTPGHATLQSAVWLHWLLQSAVCYCYTPLSNTPYTTARQTHQTKASTGRGLPGGALLASTQEGRAPSSRSAALPAAGPKKRASTSRRHAVSATALVLWYISRQNMFF
jgi:hypothetical protein